MQGQEPNKEKLKWLGQEALDLFYPPDFVEFEGLDGKVTIPGATCVKTAKKDFAYVSCTDRTQASQAEAISKVAERLTADGFTVTKNDDRAVTAT